MNAYELANQLAVLAMLNNLDEANTNEIEQSANMLRQQADRIAELEKDLLKYDRLAWDDLNKQGSEPYCWRMKANDPNDKDWWLFGRNPNRDEKVSHSAIPLYTTPQTKPLSDDEVIKIRQTTKAKSTENWADTLAFARAIEERHKRND